MYRIIFKIKLLSYNVNIENGYSITVSKTKVY